MVKIILQIIGIVLFTVNSFGQDKTSTYNKALADSLGADEYGMRSYVLAILKTGSKTTDNKDSLNLLFRGHMENINKLANEGKLVVAGPLGKNDNQYRGIFILSAKSIEEARNMVNTDPSVKYGIFDVELYIWYGSAALPTYLETHKRIEVKKP